jgi:hypothetical protein
LLEKIYPTPFHIYYFFAPPPWGKGWGKIIKNIVIYLHYGVIKGPSTKYLNKFNNNF